MIRNTKVRQALEFIHENYNHPISVRGVADNVCLSRNHFGKLFKKETGYNLIDYINNFRILRAKQFLQDHPEADFMTVAEGIGFSDVYYFLRVFKKYTAQSPRQYKKSLKCIEMPTLMEKPSISFGISSRNTRFNGDDEAKRMESGNAGERINQNQRI